MSVENLPELDKLTTPAGEGLDKAALKRITPGSLRGSRRGRNLRMHKIVNGVRILQEDAAPGVPARGGLFAPDPAAYTIHKTATVVPGSPEMVFKLVMNVESMPMWDASVDSANVIEEIDSHSAVLHIKYKPVTGAFWPLWSRPRDLCIMRNWRREEDGSYIIIYQSTQHSSCPTQKGYVRAYLHGGGYTIAPRKQRAVGVNGRSRAGAIASPSDTGSSSPMSLLTFILHIDLRLNRLSLAWQRMKSIDYIEHYVVNIIGIRDVLQQTGFVSVHLVDEHDIEPQVPPGPAPKRTIERLPSVKAPEDESPSPAPPTITYTGTLSPEYWGTPDVSGIKVRGKSYPVDKKKVAAELPAFRLVGVDFFEVKEHQEHIALRPETLVNRIEEQAAFMFIIQLMIPGSTQYSVCIYFTPDDNSPTRGDGSPFSKVLAEFLDGTDEERTDRFKLIPRVVEGSWIVRQTVGNTPTILGRKVRQPYHIGSNYIEVDVDIASSSVAAAVLGVCGPVAKSLVVDVIFLLEGKAEDELPEKILGAVRLNHLDMKKAAVKLPPIAKDKDS
mmetsp:Transcript_33797/g.40846  ORF Transcript_33797/g.40846 Transcript_33797/m.40846 type:complete len:556 (-) Transcript_33797:334-2001(-)|eukprot:CAMPEP_0197857918 /NCGR_PEP_ID=MMETSP1438-20131217/31363_1 /TAXON_ID=1461541 /ORGANISM="Pterosperma sp., Strain CCMP1384" /LENGTH=555 /DNA_ID=CAMNT_0043473917 /DNA_START=554 /DNA_END=2221 /DNA_ORIENTATION=-